jgi:hypothetical protein
MPSMAKADEGGVSFWLPGPIWEPRCGQPGMSLTAIEFYDNVRAGGDVAPLPYSAANAHNLAGLATRLSNLGEAPSIVSINRWSHSISRSRASDRIALVIRSRLRH